MEFQNKGVAKSVMFLAEKSQIKLLLCYKFDPQETNKYPRQIFRSVGGRFILFDKLEFVK
jgi:hypothetical protein